MKMMYEGLLWSETEIKFEGYEGSQTVNVYHEGKNVDVFSYAGKQGKGIEDYGTFRTLCEGYLNENE